MVNLVTLRADGEMLDDLDCSAGS